MSIKVIYIYILVFLPVMAWAQVGINTKNAQTGWLHIDSQGNNPTSGSPSASQASDDVFVSNQGNLAIGHIAPQYKLDIRMTSAKPAFKLEDGTEGNTKILLSDASGNASWGYPGEIDVIRGTFTGTVNYGVTPETPVRAEFIYLNAYIKLPEGRWLVMVDLKVTPVTSSYDTSPTARVWLRTTFSDNTLSGDGVTIYPSNKSGISADIEGSAGGTSSVASLISGHVNFRVPSHISGFVIINNQSGGVKTYYMKLYNAPYPAHLNLAGKSIAVGNPSFFENRITALPLQ